MVASSLASASSLAPSLQLCANLFLCLSFVVTLFVLVIYNSMFYEDRMLVLDVVFHYVPSTEAHNSIQCTFLTK